MRSLPIFLVTVALVLGSAFAAMAAPLANCGKKLESFDFMVDYSGSMLMSYPKLKKVKLEVAKSLISSINDRMPQQNLDGGLHTVAPASTIVPQGAWNRATLDKSLSQLRTNLDIVGRMTPIGDSFKIHEPMLTGMKRKAAVILFSDGENNRGLDPVGVIQNIYQTQRDLVFHIVSLADTKDGKATLDRIAALNKETVYVDAYELATNSAALDKFVQAVFCGEEEVLVLRGVNFAFDSSALDGKAMGILNEAAAQLKSKSGRIVLQGWTDSIGTDEYNARLSQRRADSVKDYLIKQGVPAARLSAVGKGKSFKYDNKTAEGRYMNRRTEVLTD